MNTIRLLVADDEQLECDALELFISESGHDITCLKAKNGREAVTLARQHRPQILILDIQMPGMNGLEAAEKIREFLPGSLIVFLTAWGKFEFAQKAIRIGAADYLVKPVDGDKIKRLLDTCISVLNRNEEKNAENKDSADIYNNLSLQQTVTRLQHNVLDGNLDQAMGTEQELFEMLYRLYGQGAKAGHELYELLLVFCYGVCKSVPFLYQKKPETENLRQLETILAEFVQSACDAVRQDKKDKYERVFLLVTDYINGHYKEQLSTECIAKMFNIHPGYFTQLFHKYCGKTFVEYLTDTRMKKATELLTQHKSIKETAAESGYTDTNYFSRVFRKYYGVSPTEYPAGSTNTGET